MRNQGKGDVGSAVSIATANRGCGPNRAVEEIIACCRQTRLVSAGEHTFEWHQRCLIEEVENLELR